MFLKQVLIQAMDLGKMMLISGAGVSRVEDTIERICLAYGAREVEAFTITSSIVVTVTTEDGDVFTQTKRIKYYKTDFHKLDRLNDLSRYVCREKPDITYLEEKLSDRISDRRDVCSLFWRRICGRDHRGSLRSGGLAADGFSSEAGFQYYVF